MNVEYKSTTFNDTNIVSVYARLYNNGVVRMIEVDINHKTIREWSTSVDKVENVDKLKLMETVLYSGMTSQERKAFLERDAH